MVKDGAFVPPGSHGARIRLGHQADRGPRGQPRALRGARPLTLRGHQRLPAAVVPVTRGPGGRADLARHPGSSASATTCRTCPATRSPPAWHRQAAEVRGWDLLLSQSPWATPVLRKAFGYQGEVLESAATRATTCCRRPTGRSWPRRCAARLGIAAGVSAWSSTRRPGATTTARTRTLRLDLAEARRVLGPGHEFLIRAHSMQAAPQHARGSRTSTSRHIRI